MKIVDFKRDDSQAVVAVLEDESLVTLSWDYVMTNKPQIGDDFAFEAKEAAKEAAIETPIE